MQADIRTPPRRAERRTPTLRLREQLLRLAEGQASLAAHAEKPWASVTFSGVRHRCELVFEGAAAVAAGETFIAFLPEHEFAIPGQLVADAAVVSVDHQMVPAPRLAITCELLLLDDR